MDPPVGRFTCSGGKKSSVNGTFAYINLYSDLFLPSEPWTFHGSLRRALTAKATSERVYLSLNGNRIPTCYFLWEDFLGCCSPRAPKLVRDYVEGFTHEVSA